VSTELKYNLGVFILTHGRPDNVLTYRLLQRAGYTGPIHIVIDNEDVRAAEYRANFPSVLEFDKAAVAETFDTADLSTNRKAVVFARNAAHRMAVELGYTHYIEMDDDYDYFSTRFIADGKLPYARMTDFNRAANITLDFLEASGALTVAWAQGGDLIGGLKSPRYREGLMRKAMNLLFIRTSRPVNFVGRINEDVNTYVTRGMRGELFFTPINVVLNQLDTQSNTGGMTETYAAEGTYVKSFYSVMMAPSCVKVGGIKGAGRGTSRASRLHHAVMWKNAVPCIISDRYRKLDA
jgi:hypothetical protein